MLSATLVSIEERIWPNISLIFDFYKYLVIQGVLANKFAKIFWCRFKELALR